MTAPSLKEREAGCVVRRRESSLPLSSARTISVLVARFTTSGHGLAAAPCADRGSAVARLQSARPAGLLAAALLLVALATLASPGLRGRLEEKLVHTSMRVRGRTLPPPGNDFLDGGVYVISSGGPVGDARLSAFQRTFDVGPEKRELVGVCGQAGGSRPVLAACNTR